MIRRPQKPSTFEAALAAGALAATLGIGQALADDCKVELAAASTSGTVEDVLARARAAFEAKRFAEASALFRAAALEHPEHALATTAARQSLDALNQVGASGTSPCVATMAADAEKYVAVLCSSTSARADREEDCGAFRGIVTSVVRLDAETLMRRADAEHGEVARKLALEAAETYMRAFQGQADACKRHKTTECAHADELLYNATRAFRASGSPSKAFAVRELLFAPESGLDKTPLARRALFDQGGAFLAIGEFERAATLFERFVDAAPAEEHAEDAVENAIVIRASLGELDEARKDEATFEKLFGSKRADLLVRVRLGLATDLVERGQFADADKLLHGPVLDHAKPVESLLIRSLRGRALLASGKTKQAEELLEGVAHARPKDIVPLDTGLASGNGFAERDFARVASAVGRARLHFARVKQGEAMKLEVKKGRPETLLTKRAAVERAEKAYGELNAIEPFPPPNELVVAAAEVARMRAQLWGQTYLALGKDSAEPLERDAVGAYEMCLSYATRYQTETREAVACATWLEHHDPSHHPPLVEILPKPRFRGEGPSTPPTPLERNGEPVEPAHEAER